MKFGVREICDVTFKTTADNQKVGKTTFAKAGTPAFFIDTATTSSLEQATTTVYAQGGRGYSRLIAWEGEKTMTFTIEDALISPMGLAVLSGAGLMNASADNLRHVHVTLVKNFSEGKAKVSYEDLLDELGLAEAEAASLHVCNTTEAPIYGIVVDGSGAGVAYLQSVTVASGAESPSDPAYKNTIKITKDESAEFTLGGEDSVGFENATVKLDFYILMDSSVTEVTIAPEDFGGYFYIEAQTLFRREDTGKDMAAEIIIPKAKVQSGFTFTMAASGDPSTFTFTIDALPGYTMFDKTKKLMCAIQMIGTDKLGGADTTGAHDHSSF